MAKCDDFRDLNDWKLETSLEENPPCFVHISYKADRASGINKRAIVERWIPNPEPLGKGGSGIVWLHRESSSDKKMRAVKQVSKFGMERDNIDYKKELLALTKFSGKKFSKFEVFVDFIAWFEDKHCVYFAMEYYPLGTLQGFINGNMVEDDVRIISSQLIAGLGIMHEEGFAHRDLKPQNIFIVRKSPEWWIKIGDFGITKRSSNVTALQTQIGTPLYRAPEVSGYIKGAAEDSESGTYTNAVDIWSFGCVVYEMLALQVPFANSAIVVDFCNGGAFPAAPLTLRASNQGLDFVKRILISHPQRRRKASEIEKDPWFCGAALQKAMTALNLRNDKHSNPHFSDIGVEAGADIVHTAAFQRTLAAGMAAGMTAAAGVAVAAANLYNGKRSNGQFSKIGVEGDTDVVLGHPSLENGELLESSVVDKIKPDNYSISRTGLSYIYEPTLDNALFEEVTLRTIMRAFGSADWEVLDSRFRVIPGGKESSEFWREGRVFMLLCSQPAGGKPEREGTRDYSHMKIRRFVIIRDNHGHCLCLAIRTYDGWATLEPNLPDPHNHAIIFTSDETPMPHSYMTTYGVLYSEELSKEPIRVVREQSDREGELDSKSRINYTKVYTVEKYVRVLNIGIVDKRSLNALREASPIKPAPQGSIGRNRRKRRDL